MYDVAAVGMCTYDEFMFFDSYPEEDQKYIAHDVVFQYGGMATNVAVNLSKLGFSTSLISVVGHDEIGRGSLKHLSKEGVDTSGVRIIDTNTQRAYILVNKSNASRTAIAERIVRLTALNAIQRNIIRNSRLVYLDGSANPKVLRGILESAGKWQYATFYNLEFLSPEGRELFQQSTYGVMSAQVANEIGPHSSHRCILKKLWKVESKLKGITAGKNGSLFYDGNKFTEGAVYVSRAVDSTGAGDAFQAGVILGILKRFDLRLTLDVASVMAGLICSVVGAHGYAFDLEELVTTAKNMRTQEKR